MKVVSWDSNNINDVTNYTSVIMAGAYGLAAVKAIMAKRHGAWPKFGGIERPGKQIFVHILIAGASVGTLQRQLNQWFDPDDETPKKLIVEDDTGGTNDRYVMGICERLSIIGKSGLEWIATIRVDDDILFREIAFTAPSTWSITAASDNQNFTNNGQADAYPKIVLRPIQAKTGSWPFKRFIVVRWRVNLIDTSYPVDIVNNGLDTRIGSTNFAQADGDDLRVFVNGLEVDRWLNGINTATTKVWVNLNWEADIVLNLANTINASVTSIQVDEDITNMPSEGIFIVDSEIVTYGSKSNATRTFNDCTRGAKTSTAASHTVGEDIDWLQHDIWILYGNTTVGAPSIDDDYEPLFDRAASSNTSWDYNDFKEDAASSRPGAWKAILLSGSGESFYGGNRDTAADPYAELGQKHTLSAVTIFYGYNLCGITNANFQNGEIYQDDTSSSAWDWWIKSSLNGSSWVSEYNLGTKPSDSTWTSWSRNEALESGSLYAAIYFKSAPFSGKDCCECSDVTLTLNSAQTPTIAVRSEVGNYSLDALLTNNTTGDAIRITYSMDLSDEIEVNTDLKTVVDLEDGTNQFQAKEVVGDPRRDWLKLEPGVNDIQFDDTGTVEMEIDISWEERYYQ